MSQTLSIEWVDHIGIRVRDLDRALNFYRALGFSLVHRAENDDVAIIRNENSVELNLIFNANAGDPATNLLMDAPEKYPGYTHIAAVRSQFSSATLIATLSSCAAAIRKSSKASPAMSHSSRADPLSSAAAAIDASYRRSAG